jgi:hypothetical protein
MAQFLLELDEKQVACPLSDEHQCEVPSYLHSGRGLARVIVNGTIAPKQTSAANF